MAGSVPSYGTSSAPVDNSTFVSQANTNVVNPSSTNVPSTPSQSTQGALTTQKQPGQPAPTPTGLIATETKAQQASPATSPTFAAEAKPVLETYRKGLGPDPASNLTAGLTSAEVLELGPSRSLADKADQPGFINVVSKRYQSAQNPKGLAVNTYTKFFLETVTESDEEKYQLTETFTAFYAFFFGRRPRVFRYTGTLLNDVNHKWTNDFMFFYENYFRGTAATVIDASVILNYDGKQVSGLLLNLAIQTQSPLQKRSPFSCDVLVLDFRTTQFSLDLKGFIGQRLADIYSIKQAIAQSTAMIGKNVPAAQANIGRNVAAGKTAPSTVMLAGEPLPSPPSSAVA